MFRYTKAVCRHIPRSIVQEGLRMESEEVPLDYELAVQQHQKYIEALKTLGVEVIVFETDETLPDCVFVEDPVVVVDDVVIITNPGAPSRKREVEVLKQHFLDKEKSKIIVQMTSPAELDGGDVMFTGREIFVGLSSRTNEAGVQQLRKALSKYPVHSVPIKEKTLHLKSMMTMGGEDVIVCGQSKSACEALKIVQEKATHVYDVIRTLEDKGANCVIVNGHMLCRSQSELPKSFESLCKLSIPKIQLSASELSKVDGCLSCCSVLYN